MNKLLFAFIAAASVLSTWAIDAKAKPTVKKLTPEERAARHEQILRATGGRIIRPGSQQGRIAFVNAQRRIDAKFISEAPVKIEKATRFNVTFEDYADKVNAENAAAVLAKLGATVAVFVVDEPVAPTMLVAPEDRWAIVNVAKLAADKAGDAFVSARVRKEMVRAYVQLCGGASSQYPGTILGAIKKPSDLDEFADVKLPLDVVGRTVKYMPNLGVTRAVVAEYYEACEKGWAPAPTNEYQKAIWDDFHKQPTKGLEIKYDAKKGK